jgi:O-antigen/teichoic acid export membrane protein
VLARSVAFNFAGQVGGLTVGFASSILIARWLGPSDRGLLGVVSSFSTLAFFLLGIGLPMAAMYFGSRPDARVPALLGNAALWAVALAAVVVPLTAWLAAPLARTFSHDHGSDAWVVAAALVPVQFLTYALENLLLARLRFAYSNALTVLAGLAALAATVALVVVLHLGVVGALLAGGVGSAVGIAGSLRQLLPVGRPRVDRGLLRQMLAYGSRVQLGALFQLLNYRVDVIVIQFFAPLRVVGLYVIAQVIAELSNLVSSAFHNSVMPLIASGDRDDHAATTAAGIRHHGIAVAVSVLGIAALGPLIVLFAYGTAYRDAIVPMLILLPGMWFLGTGTVVAGDLRGRGRPGLASALAGLAVIVTVALDALLIPPFGVTGAAIASDGAYVAFGIASLVTVSRLSGLSLRTLVVPTVADLRAYRLALRRLLATRRGVQRSLPGEH